MNVCMGVPSASGCNIVTTVERMEQSAMMDSWTMKSVIGGGGAGITVEIKTMLLNTHATAEKYQN